MGGITEKKPLPRGGTRPRFVFEARQMGRAAEAGKLFLNQFVNDWGCNA
jgi:hypothetical protein